MMSLSQRLVIVVVVLKQLRSYAPWLEILVVDWLADTREGFLIGRNHKNDLVFLQLWTIRFRLSYVGPKHPFIKCRMKMVKNSIEESMVIMQ